VAAFPTSKTIVGVLEEIRANQAAIRQVMACIVTPLAEILFS